MFASRKPAIGFAAEPIPDGLTWTLTTYLSSFLAELEQEFGPRDMGWTPVGIEFSGDRPGLWYPGDRRHISIVLSDSAREDGRQALFQLAHEAVHLLSPTGGAIAPVLEEGLATLYSRRVSGRMGLNMHPSRADYLAAMHLVSSLMASDKDSIRRLRARQPQFCEIDVDLFAETCPEFERGLANVLCTPFSLFAQQFNAPIVQE